MNHELIPLSRHDTFRFSCSAKVPCFNACCADLNQFLTPYDILRLKNCLRLSSTRFLTQYTSQHDGPVSQLPVVTLKPRDTKQLECPFVSPSGCKVYQDRPASCRIYPLIRTISRCRDTGKVSERFMLLKESHCLGFQHGKTRTAGQWMEDQGMASYNQINDMLLEIISLKNNCRPGPLDPKSRSLFYTALYDLDNFRFQIFENRLLQDAQADGALFEAARKDDVALLKIGIKYVKDILLNLSPQ
jgi:hypothetical protein